MRRHGHQPQLAGSARPTPPTGGSGVKAPPPMTFERLASDVEHAAVVGNLSEGRRASLRVAAALVREMEGLLNEAADLRAALAEALARPPIEAPPTIWQARAVFQRKKNVGRFVGGPLRSRQIRARR